MEGCTCTLTGMARKATARVEPTRAIHTTDTAAGTRTRNWSTWSQSGERHASTGEWESRVRIARVSECTWSKWRHARRNPKAELFIEVSIAKVRLRHTRARRQGTSEHKPPVATSGFGDTVGVPSLLIVAERLASEVGNEPTDNMQLRPCQRRGTSTRGRVRSTAGGRPGESAAERTVAQASCSESPAALIGAAHCATAEPTRTHVDSTPTTGENGSIFLTCKHGKCVVAPIGKRSGTEQRTVLGNL